MKNTLARRALALASIPLLAAPSAIGVYTYLAPESGALAAGSAAIGFEVLYVGVNVLVLGTPELRRYARNVSLAAVATAVIFNSLAHYAAKVPQAFEGAPLNMLALVLAVLAAVPLASLAYATSVLLHRLGDEPGEDHQKEHAPAGALPATIRMPQALAYAADADAGIYAHTAAQHASTTACPKCGTVLSPAAYGAARRWGHCKACKS